MPGVLDGVRIIDFGQYIAGPLAGMLLADQGADVIKVDPPGGPRMQTSANATWNRGKRSIVLDLKQAGDLATARSLIERADVVVENFRPGVMQRLGLGPKSMTEANPRLIYCSMPGFASDDPRADMPAYEGVIGAASATFRIETRDGKPPCLYLTYRYSSLLCGRPASAVYFAHYINLYGEWSILGQGPGFSQRSMYGIDAEQVKIGGGC